MNLARHLLEKALLKSFHRTQPTNPPSACASPYEAGSYLMTAPWEGLYTESIGDTSQFA